MLGARPLRRTIQREIEDVLSEKILFGEVGAGDLVTVDVADWDGESKETDKASFTFTPSPKPLPDFGQESEEVQEAQQAVIDAADDNVEVPEETNLEETVEESSEEETDK